MGESRPESNQALGCRPSVLTSCEVVERIVESNPHIESLTLVTYHEGPNWHELPRPAEDRHFQIRLRGLQQDSGERTLTRHPRSEISAEALGVIARSLRENQLLALASSVSVVEQGIRHIPMMDFKCSLSTKNLEVLTLLLRNIGQRKGYLLESGRSFHYYGMELLGQEEWRVFLGKCLLMSEHVDDRYVGHQLVDGYCVLRLSAGKLRPRVPTVVAEL
jgi:hypothetical protein